MSQSRQSNATTTARVGTAPSADTLVEAYAEDLMDDIFSDVDRILAGDESAVYAETAEPVMAETAAFNSSALTVPAMIVPLQTAVETRESAPITESDAGDEKAAEQQADDRPEKKRPWGKVLLGAACLSALAALGFWWMRQQSAPVLVPAVSDTTPAAEGVSEEMAFGDYLTRSLRVIRGEQSAQLESQQPDVPVAAAPNPASGNQPAGQPGVIERVFVPLLQPGSSRPNQRPATPSVLPAPAASSSAAQPAAPDQASGSVPNIAANSTHELVGVLELGDRSAALFEINGSSQRVYIGETVGASGWSIVSISNEEVVVRRNGEVRSIYIGQEF